MTKEEKFAKGIVVYKTDDGDYICECWAASTKHPDSYDQMSDWGDETDLLDREHQVFQWLCYLASRKTFPFHAKQMIEYAMENWYNWN